MIKSIIDLDPMFYYTDFIERLLSDFNHHDLHNSVCTWIFCMSLWRTLGEDFTSTTL